jgi:non-ribosomal peptide synthase protein (TIGR01720 family)
VKEQIQGLPHGGFGYDLLRYLHAGADTTAAMRALPQAEVLFNYQGLFDLIASESLLFKPAQESSGAAHSPLALRHSLIEVFASIIDGELQVGWVYNQHIHDRDTIERLAQRCLDQLRALIAYSQSVELVEVEELSALAPAAHAG